MTIYSYYDPDRCDGRPCCGVCERCSYINEEDNEQTIYNQEKMRRANEEEQRAMPDSRR